MPPNVRKSKRTPARLAWSFILPIVMLLAPVAHADALDTVLDILYKAGVIDGNVHAAKPLITCLANGGNVLDCTAASGGKSEFANDPQVKNVIDIYQAFRAKDYYTVLKKSGITVGCALIPGGEIKDVLCGELGKIAAAALDGVGSVLGAIGNFVVSMFGGGSDPPPMPPESYYTLNFMPWYHWSVVYQLDNDTPANNQVLNAPIAACVDYFYHHTYSKADANKVCASFRARMSNTGYVIGNAFRDETESYFQLHFAPKVEEWAQVSFNNNDNINILAKQAMNSCLWDERQHIPLPSPGYEQCTALKQSTANLPVIFQPAVAQMLAQCQTLAKARSVPQDNDAYTRICTPMKNRVIGKVILKMGELKSRMDTAAAAGCPNNGYPKSIHCDTFATHDACMNAMPEHASMCSLNFAKAIMDTADAAGCKNSGTQQSITCTTFMAHANCLKAMPDAYDSWCQLDDAKAIHANAELILEAVTAVDAPCSLGGAYPSFNTILCVHPMQIVHCNSTRAAIGDAWGSQAVAGIACDERGDIAYDQFKQQAAAALAALNAEYSPNQQDLPCPDPNDCQHQGGLMLAPGEQAPTLHAVDNHVLVQTPVERCQLARHDPLVIVCPATFHWESIPARATAVRNSLYSTDATGRPNRIYCLPDTDHDGAEAPCLEGEPNPDLPPAVDMDHPPQELQPVEEQRPIQRIQRNPAPRVRRAPAPVEQAPVIQNDGGGGG